MMVDMNLKTNVDVCKYGVNKLKTNRTLSLTWSLLFVASFTDQYCDDAFEMCRDCDTAIDECLTETMSNQCMDFCKGMVF